MTPKTQRSLGRILAMALFAQLAMPAMADGMKPETSVIVLNEADGETSINIQNTDAGPALLYSSIHNIPEDDEPLAMLTPPVVRVEGGQTQLVRFINQSKEPLKTQRLKRVFFEGIPQKDESGGARINITVRQDIPLILHPKGLPKNREPWKLLTWSVESSDLVVRNDSAYVVRLAQMVKLQPAGTEVSLPRTYVLPGETFKLPLPANTAKAHSVRLFPATVYGYAVDSYDAPLTSATNSS
ncbi:fimbria/pilus chaperone family protein [Dyella subtropica]|uniref:fimbria/pilus chaperone family protein n=1 Tax=Dyella subtropica TaxID=2992127 RepID=UPI00224E9829|nr:fimbria/pilus chaperone family protein [Dyella subtropica]